MERKESGGGGAKARVLLVTESEEGTERFIAAAKVKEEDGARVFTFEEDGARYTVHTGTPARLMREGAIAYELVLDVSRETPARIRTEYGEIAASVKTSRAESEHGIETTRFEADYSLFFSEEERKHRIKFSARPVRGGGKGG